MTDVLSREERDAASAMDDTRDEMLAQLTADLRVAAAVLG